MMRADRDDRRRPPPAGAATILAVTLAATLGARTASAQLPACAGLTGPQAQALRQSLAALYPYDGCDQTFERCLALQPVAPVVRRLADDVCRQIKAGRGLAEIERGLARRAQSMLPVGRPATIALDARALAGEPQAPVSVVVYACTRCPFCAVVVPALYRAVTEGELRDKARLAFRPFPIRDHPGSSEGGLALIAAARAGAFWPLVLRLYERYDSFCPQRLPEWAAELGLDALAFEREMASPSAGEELVAAKQEGIRNKVEATPTIFIDGRKYVYEPQPEVLIDVLLEAYEGALASRRRP